MIPVKRTIFCLSLIKDQIPGDMHTVTQGLIPGHSFLKINADHNVYLPLKLNLIYYKAGASFINQAYDQF